MLGLPFDLCKTKTNFQTAMVSLTKNLYFREDGYSSGVFNHRAKIVLGEFVI